MDELIEAAKAAMERAYAPYSKFRVGAALLGGSGTIHTGCNVENASYGLTICAERAAVSNAVCAGEREIRAVAIVNSSGKPAYPCGACRQVLVEFMPAGGDVEIYIVSDGGVERHMLSELLPHAFDGRVDG